MQKNNKFDTHTREIKVHIEVFLKGLWSISCCGLGSFKILLEGVLAWQSLYIVALPLECPLNKVLEQLEKKDFWHF